MAPEDPMKVLVVGRKERDIEEVDMTMGEFNVCMSVSRLDYVRPDGTRVIRPFASISSIELRDAG